MSPNSSVPELANAVLSPASAEQWVSSTAACQQCQCSSTSTGSTCHSAQACILVVAGHSSRAHSSALLHILVAFSVFPFLGFLVLFFLFFAL